MEEWLAPPQPLMGCLPDDFAGLFVESDHGGVVAAGSADELVAVDQGRFAVAPAGHHLSIEIFLEILFPDDVPLGRVEADEVGIEAEDVNLVAVHGGSTVRAGMLDRVCRGDVGRPDALAGLLVEAEDEAAFIVPMPIV